MIPTKASEVLRLGLEKFGYQGQFWSSFLSVPRKRDRICAILALPFDMFAGAWLDAVLLRAMAALEQALPEGARRPADEEVCVRNYVIVFNDLPTTTWPDIKTLYETAIAERVAAGD